MAGAFSAIVARDERKPARVVKLPASCWARTWADRPLDDVEVGLRVPAEAELVQARAEAAQRCWRDHREERDEAGRIERYNSFLMARVVARGTTEAEDASVQYFGEYADDKVTEALTPNGIEFLYGEIDRLHIEESPIAPEASHDEVVRLAEALRTGAAWKDANGAVIARARRMLRHVIDLLNLTDAESE
jgi:hypothetical protein